MLVEASSGHLVTAKNMSFKVEEINFPLRRETP